MRCIVYFSAMASHDPILFANGETHIGIGPDQSVVHDSECKSDTLGRIRKTWGDDSIGYGWPDSLPVMVWLSSVDDPEATVIIMADADSVAVLRGSTL